MSDDPRGHDDGDIIVGAEERERWLLALLESFLLDLSQTGGYSFDELTKACQTVAGLRRGRR